MRTSYKTFCIVAATLGMLIAGIGFSACDDGNLNTVVEQESLAEYMGGHPELRLYLNAVSNYREPMYICIYDMESGGTPVTPMPLGRYGSAEGIPYGEITAVDVKDAYASLEDLDAVEEVFVTDGFSPCPESLQACGDLGRVPAGVVVGSEDASIIRIVDGLLASSEGGEEWMVCGDTGDGPCVENSHMGSGLTGLLPNTPLDASKTTVTFWKIGGKINTEDETYTFCWNDGEGSTTTLGPYPIPYEPPYRGWFDVDPLLSGAILLFDGDIECADANPADAIASTPIPADATFGPDGSTVQYEAGSSGTLLVIGESVPGIPTEAGLKIIPILHWFE